MVPNRSIKTINLIEKKQNPHISGKKSNSARLCMVELIHLLLCDRSTLHVFGATV
jgi:hypothetical protein